MVGKLFKLKLKGIPQSPVGLPPCVLQIFTGLDACVFATNHIFVGCVCQQVISLNQPQGKCIRPISLEEA